MPKVTIIIPCYNQGEYVDEAVNSVLRQSFRDFEIIIVNDGSTDELTNELLAEYERPRVTILYSENKGVSAARNLAIRSAKGQYILPLDADDKIGKEYLKKAVEILDRQEKTGIVYCKAEFFGRKQGEWDLKVFSLESMLSENLIFCTALYRKTDWERTRGYNENMLEGYEDWDFWISMLELEVGVHRIAEILFSYRIKKASKNKTIMEQEEKKLNVYLQIIKNHKALYSNNMESVIKRLETLSNVIVNKDRELGRVKKPWAQKAGSKIKHALQKLSQ